MFDAREGATPVGAAGRSKRVATHQGLRPHTGLKGFQLAFLHYKSDQGFWTRAVSGAGAGLLAIAGLYWLTMELSVIRDDSYRLYVQAGVCVGLALGFFLFVWWLLNKPRVADFMIATESEMRKVNWPSRREITGSTWLVICGTLLMALLLFVVDIGFALLFQTIGVLDGGG